VKPSAPIRDYLDALVHPTAQDDVLMAARHRAFIAPRLFGSLVVLGVMPVFLAFRGVPTMLEFVVLAWMVVPIATAYYLSRTGRFESAHVLSALALSTIVTIVAGMSGGINSFAAIWLVLIPLEAAVSGSRRVVTIAALLALGGAALLIVAGSNLGGAASLDQTSETLTALGIVSAALYATGIALGAEQVTRTNSLLLGLEEDQYRLLAGNMTDVITRHEPNGRVVFASPNAAAVLGAVASELQGHGLFDRIHISDRPAFLNALSEAAVSGDTRNIEFRLRRTERDGAVETVRFTWIEMSCRPLDAGGAPEGDAIDRQVVAVMRDVSRRKAEQDALIAARAEAERANAAKSRFLAIMSHELRTPLNAIIGFSDMLRNESQISLDAGRRQEYARLINDSGYHLLAVVNDILDMSRLETGDFEITAEPFRLDSVMIGCHELLELKARDAGVELGCEMTEALPDIVGDKRAVKQILINLISNAIKFTDRGGSVMVKATRDGAHVILSVEDTGIGIAPDDLARIGSPFFQVRANYARKHDGAGLGLSIVKGLVKLHGGELDIRSRPGEGTSVLVRLPLDCEATLAAERESNVVLHKSIEKMRSTEPQIAAIESANVLEPAVKKRA
jgi:cell cycle sensor histidine kinase DivJ